MIYYKKRRKYKYNIAKDYFYPTGILPGISGNWGKLGISDEGLLHIHAGYSYDGASGPAIDTPNVMRAALVHDALYQLMREDRISRSNRKRADQILREICIESGMSRIRAGWIYAGVRIGSAAYAESDLLTAP